VSGALVTKGDGTLKTGPDGTLLIKNLAPAKYTIQIVPPAGSNWHQTSTIEGTKGIDAWVKANEPSFFQEFGPPGHHVFIGFVQDFKDTSVLNGSASISGTVVNLHNSRPPDYAFYNGHPIPNCRVGLNELPAVGGRGLYAGPCNADSSFTISNVPDGTYQLVVWDDYLDVIFATLNVTVANGQAVDLQEVPVFLWFSRLESVVFYDANQNGYRDPSEVGMPDQVVNLRFRDGSIYQSFPTDMAGYVPFDEVFPFFNWLVAEVDFARFKATGATIAVDAGGPIDPNQYWSYGGKLNPQLQFCTQDDVDKGVNGCSAAGDMLMNPGGDNLARTETGQVLLEGLQGFLGQTSVIEWARSTTRPARTAASPASCSTRRPVPRTTRATLRRSSGSLAFHGCRSTCTAMPPGRSGCPTRPSTTSMATGRSTSPTSTTGRSATSRPRPTATSTTTATACSTWGTPSRS
jgi:hypothetical protein